MRAFFCIELKEEIHKLLGGLAADLRRTTTVRASWVPAANHHITVQFLGEIEPILTVDLQRMVVASIGNRPAFDVLLDRVSGFPTQDRPRVVWAGGMATDSFVKLVRAISDGIAPLGFPRERTPDVFHITLARLKGGVDPGLVRAMESRLTGYGPRYSPLFEVRLAG